MPARTCILLCSEFSFRMVSVVNYACDYDVPHKCDSCNGQMFVLLPKAIDTVAIYDRPFPATRKAYSLLPSRFCAICCAELRSCTMSAKRWGRVGIQVLHCCHREATCYVYCAIHVFFSPHFIFKDHQANISGWLPPMWAVVSYKLPLKSCKSLKVQRGFYYHDQFYGLPSICIFVKSLQVRNMFFWPSLALALQLSFQRRHLLLVANAHFAQ